ncbi:DNA-binding protein HU 1 (DNA-binding protein II) (HB) [Sulfurihydrogenibium azorense Az-Fu1]|jgi:DNA-binding protein HU-beta|uniref:DNA-binding protein HU 1 (DNA-binding protein II) (HB) n=1 Tax=Sulfurihydrogenibium azorense (strain DSM 15241 / OCM 825 / Az-Fu1) TaxID=204536 RepID=C1DXF9_SULAA|nr:HU family DNA-binding protein [Sulfurihydrogenibium azorense]ACN98474.1 DNA-binding protein HU 1 (DNA-binding protein II) (HB) [Sulfurihydrogenibium azorense Az-Fu1]MDM7273968.1 HU family DNA-binding protein [Sulfurihydrogenibium azorense]
MTKKELISAVAQKAGLKKAAAEKAVNAAIETVVEAISKGERVAIPGFGIFNIRERKERKGRNPRTGKEIKIPARKVVAFTAAKALKEAVNK